ncbi:unnamed protein product, partial [Polarella glacialis]
MSPRVSAWRRLGSGVAAAAALGCCALPRLAMALEETEAPSAPAPLSDADRGLALLACRSAILRKWSSGFEEIGALVNSTLDAASAADGKSEAGMDYNKAARVLAERQMAACSREVTAADVQAHKAGGLSEAAVERLLGGTALGFQLTEE